MLHFITYVDDNFLGGIRFELSILADFGAEFVINYVLELLLSVVVTFYVVRSVGDWTNLGIF